MPDAVEPAAEADRGRHPGFPSFNVLASGPGSLAERSAAEVSQGGAQSARGFPMSASAEDRVVRLATASNPQEAALWQQALEAEGIRCRLVGEMLGSFGVVYPGSVQPEIWVFESDVDRARAVLQSGRKSE